LKPRRYPDLVPVDHFTRGPVLVLAPHPDDEVAACGGMLLHHVDAGNPVHVAFLTDGWRGNWQSAPEAQYVELREEEARAACRFQGTEPPYFLGQPDGELEADGPVVDEIVTLLRSIEPAVVYCPSFFEIHNDHHAAALALLNAVERDGGDPLLMFGEIGVPLWANVLVDISSVFERKVTALGHYESQLTANDYVPSLGGLNQYRTVNIDIPEVRYAEAYLMTRAERIRPMVAQVDAIVALADDAFAAENP
jgi:LmbE family N-acetylglucosaminyl deacetylase